MMTYTVIKKTTGDIISILRSDGASIPVCDGNTDYQQYLADVAEHGSYPVEVIPDPEPAGPSIEERTSALEQYVMEKELGLI